MLLEREKRILRIGGAATVILLIVAFLVSPAISRIRTLSRTIEAAERELAELRRSKPELMQVRQAMVERTGAVTAAANAKQSPLAHLTAALQEAGVPSSAFSVKSGGAREGEAFREESFEVRMENLTYLEAVKALRKFSGKDLPLVVRSTLLKSRYDDPRYVDVTLSVGYLAPRQRK